MDTLLIFTSLLLVLAGIIGSFLPVIPGPITSWFGLFTIHYINGFSENNFLLLTTFIIAILIFIIDYFIPIIGSKFLGGTKYGIIGTSVGLVIGLISPIPFGIIIGAFLGALLGEIIGGKNIYQAAKPAIGSLIGIISSAFIKFVTSITYLGFYIYLIVTNKDIIYNILF